ncbi:MAG: LamG-like jellyroll fold domain-containing protein [Candidatus Paceibacterota bacterium]|jgi:prepilin-type N-terminal cleavage/methylation domain-containing protein
MRNKAFTLIELLVVIAIVGILSSVIYSNITGIRDRARITAGIRFDSSMLHSIGDQLVGEWTFDSPNLPLIDTSGFGNVGTCTNCPTYATTSGYNNKGAYSFDATNDSIYVGNNTILNSTSYTLSVWFNTTATSPDDTTGHRLITIQRVAGSTKISLLMRNNKPELMSSGGALELNTNVTANDGNWHNFTGTTDGTNYSVYLDGVLKNEATGAVLDPNFYAVSIGSNASSGFYAGLLDDVRIYTSILSASDIQKLYAEGKATHDLANK